jgi:hypothetical protein
MNDEEWLENYCLQNGWPKPFYKRLVFYSSKNNKTRYSVSCRVGSWSECREAVEERDATLAAAAAMRNYVENRIIRCHWVIDSSLFPKLHAPLHHTFNWYHSINITQLMIIVEHATPSLDENDYWLFATEESIAREAVAYIRHCSRANADVVK